MSEFKETQKMKVVQLHEQIPKQCLDPSQNPKNSPLGPKKVKNDPKIESKSNVRIERNKENEKQKNTPKLSKDQISTLTKTYKMKVAQLYEQTKKQCLNPSPTSKVARQGPKKSKIIPKLSQNQMSELKETKKMKGFQLHEQTPKQLSNPTPTPKIARQSPKKSKITLKLSPKSNVRIEGFIENESC